MALNRFSESQRQGRDPEDAFNIYLRDVDNEKSSAIMRKLIYNDFREYRIINIALDTFDNIETNKVVDNLHFSMDRLNSTGKNILLNMSMLDVYKLVIPLSKIILYTDTPIEKNDYITFRIREFSGSEYFNYGDAPKYHFHGICWSYSESTKICEIVPHLGTSFNVDFTFPTSISRIDDITFEFYNNRERIIFESEYLEGKIQYNDTGTINCAFNHNLNAGDKIAFMNFLPHVAAFEPMKYLPITNITATTFDLGIDLSAMPIASDPNRPCVYNNTRVYTLCFDRKGERLFSTNTEHFLNVGDMVVFNDLQNNITHLSQNNDGIFNVIAIDSDFTFMLDIKNGEIPNINNSGFVSIITVYTTTRSERRRSDTLIMHVKKRRHFIPLNIYVSIKNK